MKKRKTALVSVLAVLIVCGSFCLLRGYDAQEDALWALEQGETGKHKTAFIPDEIKAGFIFYPGGLVDHAAYAPLMKELANKGVLCLLLEMPFDLAVLDADAADGLTALYPEVRRWMIGGHSLGGAMAADYAAKHPEEFSGLVLLGAYSAVDLSGTDLHVLSIFGSEDGVLRYEKYEQSLGNYPEDFKEVVINGGNHAQFGSYGVQKGDGIAKISAEEQRKQTVDAIVHLLNR